MKFSDWRKGLWIGASLAGLALPSAGAAQDMCGDSFTSDDVNRSVVVHGDDMSAEDWGLFGLDRTLQQVIDTNGATTDDATTPTELLAALLNGLDVSDTGADAMLVNPDSGLPMAVEDLDAKAAAFDVENYTAIAFFNRLDLAPSDWSNCGEHRIVFEHNTLSLWLIFEAKLPNPAITGPEVGAAGDPLGCRPVAQFWDGLAKESLSSSQVAAGLETFFFEGFDDLAPVVSHAHYAEGLGQVRTNHISLGQSFDPWQLRELRTDNTEDGLATFRVDTVKGNALTELYGAGLPAGIEAGSTEATLFEQMQVDYLRGFVTVEGEITDVNENGVPDRLEELLAPELLGEAVIGGFGLSVDNGFNEWMSVSNASDNPAASNFTLHGSFAGLQAEIDNALGQDETTDALELITADHVMNRVDSQTCGGCHRTTANQDIAPGIAWPMENAFVHARGGEGGLSAALINHFLPARMDALWEARDVVTHAADLNLDGSVSINDLLIMLSQWGTSGNHLTADINGDCNVGIQDLLATLGGFGWNDPSDVPPGFAPGGRSTGPQLSELQQAEENVRTARGVRARSAALNNLRNVRLAAATHESAQQGALTRQRPVH